MPGVATARPASSRISASLPSNSLTAAADERWDSSTAVRSERGFAAWPPPVQQQQQQQQHHAAPAARSKGAHVKPLAPHRHNTATLSVPESEAAWRLHDLQVGAKDECQVGSMYDPQGQTYGAACGCQAGFGRWYSRTRHAVCLVLLQLSLVLHNCRWLRRRSTVTLRWTSTTNLGRTAETLPHCCEISHTSGHAMKAWLRLSSQLH